MGVLDGVRVLDFGRYIAGPYCAALLGDLGADVIRIEKRGGSEDRALMPVSADKETGAMFLQMNRNKRSLTLDPGHEKGRPVVQRLAKEADIVIANLPVQTLKRLGLDYETLSGINPRIILTTVSVFGAKGPYAERIGFDGIAQVMSGSAYLTGDGKTPVRCHTPYVDFGTASLAAMGTLAALMERAKSGQGQMVEGTLYGTALNFFGFHLIEQAVNASDRKAIGNRSPYAGPADIIRTKDGWITVQVLGDRLFKRFCDLIGAQDLLDDPAYATDEQRGAQGEAMSRRAEAWAKQHTTKDALAKLAKAWVPAGAVYRPQDALDDPHVQAAGFLEDVAYPGVPKPTPLGTTPVRLSRTPGRIRARAPMLGEHTDEILTEAGYKADEIEALRKSGAI